MQPPPHPPSPVPELPEVAADPAQQALVRALRSSFWVLRLIICVLLVLYACSGIFQIQPGEQGIIARFGKLLINKDEESAFHGSPVFDRGWIWWALPDPFDEKIRLSGSIHKLEIDTFLFQRHQQEIEERIDIATIRPRKNMLTPGVDGAMLTGDKNLSHGLWEVEYKIVNAADFVTHVGERPADFEPLLQRMLESSVLREVAYHKVEDITRWKVDFIANRVARRLQRELGDLHVGVDVVKVNPTTIVPAQVDPAFREVTRAEQEKKQQEHAAQRTATDILNQAAGPQHTELLESIRRYGAAQLAGADPRRLEQLRDEIDLVLEGAQGRVAIMLREAQAKANTVREDVKREYEEYTYWLDQYRQFPGPTLVHLWARMRQDVLGSVDNEVFWVPDSDIIEILVNRDPNKALEAERARLRKQMQERR